MIIKNRLFLLLFCFMMKYMPKNSARQMSGQIGIIVILITAAILTFGLSVADRVVQENKVVVDRSDSIRVFNVAETGIDEALNQIYQYEANLIQDLPTGNFASDPFNQVSVASSQSFEGYLNQGESLRIDLNNLAGGVDIKWSKTTCGPTHKVGLLLTFLHLSGTEYQSYYYLVAARDCLYNSAQNFIVATSTLANVFKYEYTLDLPASNDSSLYIQAVGAGADIQVSGGPGLIAEAQYLIESRAKSENDISNKTIEVKKSLPSAPGFMSFALFSGGTIAK